MDVVVAMLPLALVVGLSPLPVMPAVLLLMTPRPGASCTAYLLGWLAALTALVSLAVLLGRATDPEPVPEEGVGWVQVVTGVAFLAMAGVKWLRRPAPEQAKEPPKWRSALGTYTPRQSARLGAALAGANPKNLVLALAAGAEIAVFVDEPGARLVGVAAFVLVGSIGVATPMAAALVLGARAEPMLSRVDSWLSRHGTALTVVVLVVLGVLLVVKGLPLRS